MNCGNIYLEILTYIYISFLSKCLVSSFFSPYCLFHLYKRRNLKFQCFSGLPKPNGSVPYQYYGYEMWSLMFRLVFSCSAVQTTESCAVTWTRVGGTGQCLQTDLSSCQLSFLFLSPPNTCCGWLFFKQTYANLHNVYLVCRRIYVCIRTHIQKRICYFQIITHSRKTVLYSR